MADASRDFWPEIVSTLTVITPLSLLKEQAAALARKTNGLLQARVDSRTDITDRFIHRFKIVAPTLDNYNYQLFVASHGVDLYPVEIDCPAGFGKPASIEAGTQEEFETSLKRILASDQQLKVIS